MINQKDQQQPQKRKETVEPKCPGHTFQELICHISIQTSD